MKLNAEEILKEQIELNKVKSDTRKYTYKTKPVRNEKTIAEMLNGTKEERAEAFKIINNMFN